METALAGRSSGFSAREVAAGNGWRWYAVSDARGGPRAFARVLVHKDPSVILYVGNHAGSSVDRVLAMADRLRSHGWVLEEGSPSSNVFLHLKKFPENADLTGLQDPLVAASESSAS